jgi:hypothetical protein
MEEGIGAITFEEGLSVSELKGLFSCRVVAFCSILKVEGNWW